MAPKTAVLCLVVMVALCARPVPGLLIWDLVTGSPLADAIENVQKTFQDVLNSTVTISLKAIAIKAEAEQSILDAMQVVQDKIVEVQQTASHVVCTVGASEKSVQIAKNLTEGIVKCTTDEVQQSKDVMEDVANLMRKFNATLAAAQEKIDACEDEGLSAVVQACKTNEEVKALASLTPLAAETFDELVKVNKFMMSILDALTNCPKNNIAAAKEAAALLTKQIDDCVASITV